MLKIEFDTDNAAFEDDPSAEVSRILAEVSRDAYDGVCGGSIRDYNGNTVGSWELS